MKCLVLTIYHSSSANQTWFPDKVSDMIFRLSGLSFYHNKKYQKQPREVFWKKGVLKNFKQVKPQTCNFIKKEALAQVFFVNFVKFSRTPFFKTASVAASEIWISPKETEKKYFIFEKCSLNIPRELVIFNNFLQISFLFSIFYLARFLTYLIFELLFNYSISNV